VTSARARRRARGTPIAVALIGDRPQSPAPDGRDADCYRAVVVDDRYSEVEFLLCVEAHDMVSRLSLVRVAEETLLERFGPRAARILEGVGRLDAVYLSGE
jgi:hypothetical protein